VDAGVEALDVVGAHAPGADDGDAECFSHCFVPSGSVTDAGGAAS
jgi:hypothetical protein